MSSNRIGFSIKAPCVVTHPCQQQTRRIGNYSYHPNNQIGLGFASRVYSGKDNRNGQKVAIKAIDLKKQDKLEAQLLKNEIQLLEEIRRNDCPHLLKILDHMEQDSHVYIITELCEGKDVAKMLRKNKSLTEQHAKQLMSRLLRAYSQFYAFKSVHRDLKWANVFISGDKLVLADFGFALPEQQCLLPMTYNVGSPKYMSPQALKTNKFSHSSDVWAIGIMAYELVYGIVPWKDKVQSLLYDKIMASNIQDIFKHPNITISQSYKQFIVKCLHKDPHQRATSQYLINHPWIDSNHNNHKAISNQFQQISLCKQSSQSKHPQNLMRKAFLFNAQTEQKPSSTNVIEPPLQETTLNTLKLTQKPPSPTRRGQQNQPSLINQFPSAFTDLSQNPVEQKETIPKPQDHYRQLEKNILSQLNYCRFLKSISKYLKGSKLGQGYLLLCEFESRCCQKMAEIGQALRGEDSIFGCGQLLAVYKTTKRGEKLNRIYNKYDTTLSEHRQTDFSFEAETTLACVIRQLKPKISENFALLQQLCYYYQLKSLQNNHSLDYFANNSKIEILASRNRNLNEEASQEMQARLLEKMQWLGL